MIDKSSERYKEELFHLKEILVLLYDNLFDIDFKSFLVKIKHHLTIGNEMDIIKHCGKYYNVKSIFELILFFEGKDISQYDKEYIYTIVYITAIKILLCINCSFHAMAKTPDNHFHTLKMVLNSSSTEIRKKADYEIISLHCNFNNERQFNRDIFL